MNTLITFLKIQNIPLISQNLKCTHRETGRVTFPLELVKEQPITIALYWKHYFSFYFITNTIVWIRHLNFVLQLYILTEI